MRKFTFIIFLLVALTAIGFKVAGKESSPVNTDLRNKARYYYMEGAVQDALGNTSEAYEYFKKAYETDTSYLDGSYAYGGQRLAVRTDTMQSEREVLRSLQMLQKFVDRNPADLFAGRFYGYLATRLDTVEEAVRVFEIMADKLPSESFILLNLSEAYVMNRQNDKALKALERYEAIEGKSQEVTTKKIGLYLAMGDTMATIKEATELRNIDPTEPTSLILTGNLYDVIGKPDSTLYYYQLAETLNPENGGVKLALANYYMTQGDSVAYDAKLYEALLAEDIQLGDKLGILGEYLQTLIDEKGETARGDHLFSVLKDQYPHEPDVLDLSARYSAAKGDFKEAADEISYAIDLDPSNVNYWAQLMRYQFADSLPAEVARTYINAKEHIEVPEALTLMYAAALSETGDFEKAEETYISLVQTINPALPKEGHVTDTKLRNSLNYDSLIRLSSYYSMLGDLYYKAENLEKAFESYDNSLFFYESNALTLNNYAYFLAETGGDLDKAHTMSHKAISEAQDNPTYLDTYAWILFRRKEYKEALDYIELALQIAEERGETNEEYFSHAGDIYFMNHEPEKALEYWEKALALDPDNELLRKKVSHKTFFFE